MFQSIVSSFTARGFQTQVAEGKCQIIDHDQGLFDGNFLLVHPIAHGVAGKIHISRRLEQDEGLVLNPDSCHEPISLVLPSGTGFFSQIVDNAETDVVARAVVFMSDVSETDDEVIH